MLYCFFDSRAIDIVVSHLVCSAVCFKLVILMMCETQSIKIYDSSGLPWELAMQLLGTKYLFFSWWVGKISLVRAS